MADKLKWLLALLVVGGAIAAFYAYPEQLLIVRATGVIGSLAVAGAIIKKTVSGEQAWDFSKGALVEIRKVVWPSRKETTQTTVMVMAMVVLVGIILWVFDLFLGWAVKLLTGQGG